MDPIDRAACIEAITNIHEVSVRALIKVFGSDVPVGHYIDTLTQLAAARVPPPYSVQYQAGESDQQRQRGDGHGTLGNEVQMDEGSQGMEGGGGAWQFSQPTTPALPNVPIKWSKACNGFIEWLYPERVKAVSTAYAYTHSLGELIEAYKPNQTNMFTSEQELKDFMKGHDHVLRTFLPFPAKRPPRARTAYRAFYLYMTGEDLWWDEGVLFTPQRGGSSASVGTDGDGGAAPPKPKTPRPQRPPRPMPRMVVQVGRESEAHLEQVIVEVSRERTFTEGCLRLLRRLIKLDEEKKLFKHNLGENPDFDARIRRSMSFLRIKNKLKKGFYGGNYEQYHSDVVQIFDNITDFYPADHPLHVLVESKLKPVFEERYAKLKAGEEEEEEDDDGAGEADDADDHQPMDQEDSSVGVQQLIMAPEAQPQEEMQYQHHPGQGAVMVAPMGQADMSSDGGGQPQPHITQHVSVMSPPNSMLMGQIGMSGEGENDVETQGAVL